MLMIKSIIEEHDQKNVDPSLVCVIIFCRHAHKRHCSMHKPTNNFCGVGGTRTRTIIAIVSNYFCEIFVYNDAISYIIVQFSGSEILLLLKILLQILFYCN